MEYSFAIPASVPHQRLHEYISLQQEITYETGKLFLFAGDQKVEHLNEDFYGDEIDEDDANPQHLFDIAAQSKIGAFATQLGLIDRYGRSYKSVPYIVKLNSKTNVIPKEKADPLSSAWYSVDDVLRFRQQSGLQIAGVGYTLFLGSAHEATMLREAAQAMLLAHLNGMIGMVWAYPRGAYVKDERDPLLIAGAAGVAACLGADYVKVNAPNDLKQLKNVVSAAGNTKVICAGGSRTDEKQFIQGVREQLSMGAQGCAVGRNIHQKPLHEAIAFCNTLHELVTTGKIAE